MPDTNENKTLDTTYTEVEPEVLSRGHPVYDLETASPQALVVHCGDSRFQTAFRRFITEELGIKNYTPLIIGGGVHALGMQVFLPKNFKILWEQIKFYLKHNDIKQVIIINHEDCGWYEKMKGYHARLTPITKGKLDLTHAAKTILRDFTGVQVRTFWAGLENNKIYFEEIN